jgi:hypothetical protein
MKLLKSTLITLLIVGLAWLMLVWMGAGVPEPTYRVPAVGKIYYSEGKSIWGDVERVYVRVDSINDGTVSYVFADGQAGSPMDIEHFREVFPLQAH